MKKRLKNTVACSLKIICYLNFALTVINFIVSDETRASWGRIRQKVKFFKKDEDRE